MRKRIRLTAAVVLTAVAAVAVVAAVMTAPAKATPSEKSTCSACHRGTPSGTVKAIPDTATPAPKATYHVAVSVNLGAAGNAGYWITSNDAGTPDPSKIGGPSSATSFNVAMTAPAAAGTYTYKVWGVKGAPSSGQALATTYSITVQTAPPAPDTTAPNTTASGASANGWFNHAVPVTLTASDNAGGSGVASITYSIDGLAPVTVKAASAPITMPGTPDGAHTVTFHAVDAKGNVEPDKSLTVNIDTFKPTTLAPLPTTVKAGTKATLHYEVDDAAPNAGTANVKIKIKTKAGKVVKTLKLGSKSVNTPLAAKFVAKLPRGTYRFFVSAKDAAGNAQSNIASNKLVVK